MSQQDTTHYSLSGPTDSFKEPDFLLHGPAKKIAAHYGFIGFVAGVVLCFIVFFHVEKHSSKPDTLGPVKTAPVPGPLGAPASAPPPPLPTEG